MDKVKILFIGDIVGKPGIQILQTFLKSIVQNNSVDFIIANGENLTDGRGIIEKDGKSIFELGVNVITGGNHIWEKHKFQEYSKAEKNVLRPLNYPKGTYGQGYVSTSVGKNNITVISLQGRAYLPPIDCPFRTADWVIEKVKSDSNIIIIDFHAEATAEKVALAVHLDGKVSAIIGTHTHVQTADERIFPNGTAYITDVGMTGPYDSVIGMKKDAAVNRFLYQTPQKYQTATDDVHISAVIVTIDAKSGKSLSIERLFFPEFDRTSKDNGSTNN
ncbi:MAG: TIGR00282 family metallophosphoesterase [Ignavibacteria bacterium]|nr:TIGR00282 family metallophosphoesterase [Ignavibacteria bacterium]